MTPEVAAEHKAADEMQQSIQDGTPDEPLVGDAIIRELSRLGVERVREAMANGEPIFKIRDRLDAKENQSSRKQVAACLNGIDSLVTQIQTKYGDDYTRAEGIKTRVEALRKLLGIKP